ISFGHVLRATGVQIPEDDLDNLHSLREVDGILVFVDPQDLLGFLEYTNLTTGLGDSDSRTIGFLEGTSLVVVILVKGHAVPITVKVRPVGLARNCTSFIELEPHNLSEEALVLKDIVEKKKLWSLSTLKIRANYPYTLLDQQSG
ncbi:hypothetical protein Tco_0175802, partial [Tanacetum coccineum]